MKAGKRSTAGEVLANAIGITVGATGIGIALAAIAAPIMFLLALACGLVIAGCYAAREVLNG